MPRPSPTSSETISKPKPTILQELRRRQLRPRPARSQHWCQCAAECAAWSAHPLGRRLPGSDFNFHPLQAAEEAELREYAAGGGRGCGAAELAARVEGEVALGGRYLVRRGAGCGAGGECFVSVETMQKEGWEGWCEAHKRVTARGACGVPGPGETKVWPFG